MSLTQIVKSVFTHPKRDSEIESTLNGTPATYHPHNIRYIATGMALALYLVLAAACGSPSVAAPPVTDAPPAVTATMTRQSPSRTVQPSATAVYTPAPTALPTQTPEYKPTHTATSAPTNAPAPPSAEDLVLKIIQSLYGTTDMKSDKFAFYCASPADAETQNILDGQAKVFLFPGVYADVVRAVGDAHYTLDKTGKETVFMKTTKFMEPPYSKKICTPTAENGTLTFGSDCSSVMIIVPEQSDCRYDMTNTDTASITITRMRDRLMPLVAGYLARQSQDTTTAIPSTPAPTAAPQAKDPYESACSGGRCGNLVYCFWPVGEEQTPWMLQAPDQFGGPEAYVALIENWGAQPDESGSTVFDSVRAGLRNQDYKDNACNPVLMADGSVGAPPGCMGVAGFFRVVGPKNICGKDTTGARYFGQVTQDGLQAMLRPD